MQKEYSKIEYDYKAIALKKIYEHPEYKNFTQKGVETANSKYVFGDVRFPDLPSDKAYTLACFVTSMDGKLSYPDNPAGPVIAQSNFLDPNGAAADFWVLNLFRASVEGIFVGAGTMQKEPNGTVHIFDKDLEEQRIALGYTRAPWAIVCSLDGSDIPFNDTLMDNQPAMFNTSPTGLEIISKKLKQAHYVVGPYTTAQQVEKDAGKITKEFEENRFLKIPVIVTGEGSQTDSDLVLKIIKLMGIHRAMIESPSYCHSMLQQGLLSELVCNYSCVYIGGNAMGFGNNMPPCTSTNHPHTEVLSMHSHSPSFFYIRHKIVYDVKAKGYMGSVY